MNRAPLSPRAVDEFFDVQQVGASEALYNLSRKTGEVARRCGARVRDLLKINSPEEEHTPPLLPRDRARELRRKGTDAEHRLWSRLRNKGLGVKFRRQHPIGPYVVDFFSLEGKLVVELDGGQHNDDDGRHADQGRTRFLESRGYRILRFWNNEVLQDTDAVLLRIADLL